MTTMDDLTTGDGPLADVARAVKGAWWALLVVGIAWVIVGFVVLRFDDASLDTVAFLFFVVLLLGTVGEIWRARVTSGGWRVWHIIFAILLAVAAVIAIVHPGDTIVALGATIGFFFVFAGTFDVISSLFSTQISGWWVQLIAGILEVVLGIIASGSLASGITVLLTVVATAAIFRGLAEIGAAFAVRSAARNT